MLRLKLGIVGTLLGLAACGRMDVQEPRAPASAQQDTGFSYLTPSATATFEDPDAWAQNTPTDPDRTAIANIEHGLLNEQHDRATAFARPSAIPASDPLPTYIPPPTERIALGIHPYTECGAIDGDPVFSTENCWSAIRNGAVLQVDAGAIRADQRGAISVYVHTPGGATIPAELLMAPEPTSALHIISATYPSLVVADANGASFTFNLETHEWGTSNGTPLPATLTVTPAGQ